MPDPDNADGKRITKNTGKVRIASKQAIKPFAENHCLRISYNLVRGRP